MDTRPTERVMNLNRSFGRGAAVSSKVAELVERSDDKVIAALRISRFRIPLQSGTAKGGTKQTERNHLDFIRPRSSAWIEQRFPKPEVGRSNRLGGTRTFQIDDLRLSIWCNLVARDHCRSMMVRLPTCLVRPHQAGRRSPQVCDFRF